MASTIKITIRGLETELTIENAWALAESVLYSIEESLQLGSNAKSLIEYCSNRAFVDLLTLMNDLPDQSRLDQLAEESHEVHPGMVKIGHKVYKSATMIGKSRKKNPKKPKKPTEPTKQRPPYSNEEGSVIGYDQRDIVHSMGLLFWDVNRGMVQDVVNTIDAIEAGIWPEVLFEASQRLLRELDALSRYAKAVDGLMNILEEWKPCAEYWSRVLHWTYMTTVQPNPTTMFGILDFESPGEPPAHFSADAFSNFSYLNQFKEANDFMRAMQLEIRHDLPPQILGLK